jgi:hypothetical protein
MCMVRAYHDPVTDTGMRTWPAASLSGATAFPLTLVLKTLTVTSARGPQDAPET